MNFPLIALLIPLLALADISEQEAKNQTKAAQEAATAADSALPPCEGHDHLHETIARFAPPSSCPKAKEAFDFLLSASDHLRKNCRDSVHWIEARLRSPGYCSSDGERNSAMKTLNSLKRKAMPPEEPARIEKILSDKYLGVYIEAENKPVPESSEWSRRECRNPVLLALQLRTRQAQLANKHFGMADEAISSVCDEGPKGADDYLDFARKGEDGL